MELLGTYNQSLSRFGLVTKTYTIVYPFPGGLFGLNGQKLLPVPTPTQGGGGGGEQFITPAKLLGSFSNNYGGPYYGYRKSVSHVRR